MYLIKICIGILLIFYMQYAVAILPPYYQSIREIEHILSSDEVAKKLSTHPIQSIIRNEGGEETSYNIRVNHCTLKVKIIYKPADKGFVGPEQFEVIPDPVCLPNKDS